MFDWSKLKTLTIYPVICWNSNKNTLTLRWNSLVTSGPEEQHSIWKQMWKFQSLTSGQNQQQHWMYRCLKHLEYWHIKFVNYLDPMVHQTNLWKFSALPRKERLQDMPLPSFSSFWSTSGPWRTSDLSSLIFEAQGDFSFKIFLSQNTFHEYRIIVDTSYLHS